MVRIVWEFVVKRERVADFERSYGPEGDWAQFFRKGRGYRRTELQKVSGTPGTYRTVDVWDSKADFEAFKSEHAAEYATIDRRFENMTERESFIGSFEDTDTDGD